MLERSGLLNVFLICSTFLLVTNGHAICVHERVVLGSSLIGAQLSDHDIYFLSDNNQFQLYKNENLIPIKKYLIQEIKKTPYLLADYNQYNKKYIEYYRYQRVKDFFKSVEGDFLQLGYEQVIVGKSIEGRNLYSIRPKQFDQNKKTIVMLGRHHGDEGTANWIIEGFVERFLTEGVNFHKDYQLVLYPMVNPDGAEAQTRYNKNSRDLNRSWQYNLSQSFDEAKTVHTDLKNYLKETKSIIIALDMHGSFTEDFIYRVKKNYISSDFYNLQQDFIDELGRGDLFQAGNFQASNGHPNMARIVMIKSYGLNALTHETPRDIKLNNRENRSKVSLKNQGVSILESIVHLY